MANKNPAIVLLISGKRKCGKDYLSEKLNSYLGAQSCIVRISYPIKQAYADSHNLSLEELLSDGPYKENYRIKMILWSDEIRAKDPSYFCKIAADKAPKKPIWIVSDIRRKTDVDFFETQFKDKVKKLRINVNNSIRESRGWKFTEGVDNVTSECDLDDYQGWHLVINNDGQNEDEKIKEILNLINYE